MLRMAMILAMTLVALTAVSSGSIGIDIIGSNVGNAIISGGEGSVNMDIVGSNTGDAHITSDGSVSADVEVVGSTTGEINISSEVPPCTPSCCCNMWCNLKRPICYPYSSYIPNRCTQPNCYPYNQSMHMGVDAWHGCYWYSPIYMPKWPSL